MDLYNYEAHQATSTNVGSKIAISQNFMAKIRRKSVYRSMAYDFQYTISSFSVAH